MLIAILILAAASSVTCLSQYNDLFNIPLSMPKTIKYRVYDAPSVNIFDAFRAQEMFTVTN
jgi:hypothetical protein